MKNERSSSLRMPESFWEYIRIRAFQTRMSKSGYIRSLVEKDMEAENAEAVK